MDEAIQAPRIVNTDDCWLWAHYKSVAGYGVMWHNGKLLFGHRIMYENFVGEIPEGFEVDHLCRVKQCVNPLHLEPVTHKENMRRMHVYRKPGKPGIMPKRPNAPRRTHCLKGHELTPDNLYINIRSNGTGYVNRRCKQCSKEYYRKYRQLSKLKKGSE